MGVGFRTFVTARTPYVVAASSALGYLGMHGAFCTGLGFGIGRLVPVMTAISFGERGLIRLAQSTPSARSLVGRVAAVIAATCVFGSIGL